MYPSSLYLTYVPHRSNPQLIGCKRLIVHIVNTNNELCFSAS